MCLRVIKNEYGKKLGLFSENFIKYCFEYAKSESDNLRLLVQLS
jgi:hypothetical protein